MTAAEVLYHDRW